MFNGLNASFPVAFGVSVMFRFNSFRFYCIHQKHIPEMSKQQARQMTESCAQHKLHVTMYIFYLSFFLAISLSFQYRLRDCDYFHSELHALGGLFF